MKKQRHIQTTRTLLSRFRYSSGYFPAFASMGREFQIGHLHTNVVNVLPCRKRDSSQTIPYHTFMTLQEIKDQVLAGIDIAPTTWLANMADSEALYAAAPLPVARASHEFDMCSMIHAKSGGCSGELQMVCTILSLPRRKPKSTTSSAR